MGLAFDEWDLDYYTKLFKCARLACCGVCVPCAAPVVL
jgi:hypothetical protein